MKRAHLITIAALLAVGLLSSCGDDTGLSAGGSKRQPNFLFIVSDDQSWEHTSFAGYPLVATPNFDRIASQGIYFSNAYATAPTCTASRSSILAGQPIWRLGSAANLHGEYSSKMISYQHILADAGYEVGSTGKGWAPGYVPPWLSIKYAPTGRHSDAIKRTVDESLGAVDLPANFESFLDQKKSHTPFSYWVGSVEPHRPYNLDVENRFKGEDSDQYIPGVLPATRRVRQELSAYLTEIEVFDRDVGALVDILEARGLLEQTVVIVTSDNGMPFSRGKPGLYKYGVRVPLAISWGGIVSPGRVVEDFVSLADIAPTLLELAGVEVPAAMTGQSLDYALASAGAGSIDPSRDASYTAFERHKGYIRGGDKNLTYPSRAIHTAQFVYIRNYRPNRWPTGGPGVGSPEAYPFLVRDELSGEPIEPFYSLAVAKRPAEELYDIGKDPDQLQNVAGQPDYALIQAELASRLHEQLVNTGDPLEISGRDVFQDYKYWYYR
jgi:N-sulfoglucosamine sulfohydrolase